MSPPDLTVQVVNYRTAGYLHDCLTSLVAALAVAPVSSRIAVLDNGSGDDLAPIARAFAGAIDLHAVEENRGFGAGHNVLAGRNDSPLICLVNPDVLATHPDVFARLLTAFEDPGVVVAGPLLRTTTEEPQRFDHGELHGVCARVAIGAGHAHWQPRRRRTEVAWVSGAFLVVRRAAFERVGGFDEGFFLYKEEEDLCLRIRRDGGKVLYCPDAEARHVGSVVARRDPAHLAASVARFQAKHHAGPSRRVYDALYRHVTRRI